MKYFFIITLLIISTSVKANSGFPRAEIQEIIIHDWGNILIIFSEPLNHAELCENKQVIVLQPNHQFFNHIYSTLLSAFHSKTKIHGWVDGCNSKHKSAVLTRLDIDKP